MEETNKYNLTRKEKEYFKATLTELEDITKLEIEQYRRHKKRLKNMSGWKGKGYTFKSYITNKLVTWNEKLVYDEDFKELDNLHIDNAKNITINEIEKYHGYFKCRFFYGIFDEIKKKGWLRYNGLSIEEFYIEINIQKEGFYDCNILNQKGVFTGLKNRIQWDEVKNLDFKYKSNDINYTGVLYKTLAKLGATTKLINFIIPDSRHDWRGTLINKELFFSQLKFLKDCLIDEDREKLRKHSNHNVNTKYFEKYGYLPEEKYKKTYNELVNYFGTENRVLFNTNDLEFTKKIIEITNFDERKNIIHDKFKELFPNEEFKNIG